MFVAPQLIDSQDSVPVDKQGNTEQVAAKKLLEDYARTTLVSFPLGGADPFTNAVRLNSVKYDLGSTKGHMELSVRMFYEIHGALNALYYVKVGGSANAQCVIEVEVASTSAQFGVSASVNPDDLFHFYREGEARKERAILLFPSRVYIPDVMMIHEMKDAKIEVGYETLFSAKAGASVSRKVSYSHRPVIWEYEQPQTVKSLITRVSKAAQERKSPGQDADGSMFVPSEGETAGTPFPANAENDARFVRVDADGKRYRLSSLYAQHLNDEHVHCRRGPRPNAALGWPSESQRITHESFFPAEKK